MKIQVSGAIASKNGVTLFSPTGESTVYGQESWRTNDLLKAVLIPLSEAGGKPIEVELEQFSLADRIAKITNGSVKIEEKVEDGVSKVALTTASGVKVEDAAPMIAQIERAAYEGSPGLGAFLERYAKVKHAQTAAEVLKFMEKLDLPLADDGCMVLYKFLDKHPSKTGFYVDHHTRKVVQRVGSRVYMDLKDYATHRGDCGTGLHVCSKDYGQYGGQILIVKVRPEDIVAVPDHYSGKMRVLAYHLVAKLDDGVHTAVAAKKSALTAKGAKGIIAEVIAGQHIGIVEEVLVGKNGDHTVKVLDAPVVTAERGKVREIKEKPAAIDPKGIKAAIKESKGSKPRKQPELEKDLPAPSPAEQTKLAGAAPRIKQSRKAEAPVQTITGDYRVKLDKAQQMLRDGATLRQIDKALGMCRKSLARHIALGNIKA